MSSEVISVNAVSKHYGEIHAVDGVDMSVTRGEIFGLIGHNGAGKSTLFKMMLGLVKPTKGDIRISGVATHGNQFRDVRRRIAYLPESVIFYDNLSGLETLYFFAELKGAAKKQCLPLLEQMGLSKAARRPVGGYSKGMRQRLGFAQALLGKPEILFLDEPTTGLDPKAIREFYRILHDLRSDGVTTVISSHNLAEMQDRVDRLALMRLGQIQAAGTVSSLREELGLPVRFLVCLKADGETRLKQALAAHSDCNIESIGDHAGAATVLCNRSSKLAVLKVIADLNGYVDDVQVNEPSLEDVFLGYVDA